MSQRVPPLLEERPHGVYLVPEVVKTDHDLEFSLCGMIEMLGENPAQIRAHDHDVVLGQVLLGGLSGASNVVLGRRHQASGCLGVLDEHCWK